MGRAGTYLRFEQSLNVDVKALLFEGTGEGVRGDGLQPGQQRQVAVVEITLVDIVDHHF